MSEGVKASHYIAFDGPVARPFDGEIVDEAQVCIAVNGDELATIMCSPADLDSLALGFLYNEGVIDGLHDVRNLHISRNGTCVDVWLHRPDFERPRRMVLTAGCGGGVTFDDLSREHDPLESALRVPSERLAELMKQVHLGARLYQRARGIHTAALADPDQLLLQVEDLGRHNCLDKLRGAAMLAGIETRDRILLSSGRISSEMVNKARRLGTPIVCSRTSPTAFSVALAGVWNMTVVGYLRQSRMRVYTYPERIVAPMANVDGAPSAKAAAGPPSVESHYE